MECFELESVNDDFFPVHIVLKCRLYMGYNVFWANVNETVDNHDGYEDGSSQTVRSPARCGVIGLWFLVFDPMLQNMPF